jgi:type I restriction enzyme S subunit
MAGDWVERSLGDLIDIKHGFAFQGEFFRDEPPGDILLTPGNFSIGGGFKADKFKYYVGPVLDEFILCDGDLIVTMTDLSKDADTLGFPAFIPPTTDRRFLHNQRLGKIIPKESNTIDPQYLHYLMCSQEYRHEVIASATGTTVKHTSPERIKRFRFLLPQPPEQRAIAAILGSLDRKIELNRRTNETLEAMARVLFKSWFVDFGPVRAKAEGRNIGLPKEIAAIFPSRLVASELGKIPEEWRVDILENCLAELEVGRRPKGGVSSYTQGVPSIGAESVVGLGVFDFSKTKYVPWEFFNGMQQGHIRNRDLLLYKDGGRPGEFEPHLTLVGDGFPFTTCAINEHVYRLQAKEKLGQNFLFFWLSSDAAMEEMRIRGTGVAVPGLNSTQVKSLTVLVPERPAVRAFDAAVEPWVSRIFRNCNESRTLSALRNALLPKLISGELRVKDVKKFIGEAP